MLENDSSRQTRPKALATEFPNTSSVAYFNWTLVDGGHRVRMGEEEEEMSTWPLQSLEKRVEKSEKRRTRETPKADL